MVSVIIPLFNGEGFIEETIQAVLGQSHEHLEVIVVDDSSSDRGLDVVRGMLTDSRLSLITKPHSGIAGTRNVGLSWADPSSEHVLFLDQDDVIDPDMLAGLIRILAQRSDATGAYAIADFINDAGRAVGGGWFAAHMRNRRVLQRRSLISLAPTADVEWPQLFISNHLYPPSAVLLRRAAVVAVGGFDPSYEVADDWDLMLRLLRRGPIIPWNEVKVGYRRHTQNASSNLNRNIRETRAIWANTYYAAANSAGDRALLSRYWRAHQRATSRRKWNEARAILRAGTVAGATLRAIDATAHLLLFRPVRRWRTDRPPASIGARIGTRERG